MSRWQLLPPLTADEAETLAADIREHGVLDAVELDSAGEIIDGHHRAAIADSLGIEYPTVVHDWTDEKIVEHIFRKHLGRRNLTTDQRHEVVREMRQRLRWSGRRIAAALGVGEATVRRDLGAIAPDDAMPKVETSDGREYPATRPEAVARGLEAIAAEPDIQAADDMVRWARLLVGSSRLLNEGDPSYWASRLDRDRRQDLIGHIGVMRRWCDQWESALASTPRLQMVSGGDR